MVIEDVITVFEAWGPNTKQKELKIYTTAIQQWGIQECAQHRKQTKVALSHKLYLNIKYFYRPHIETLGSQMVAPSWKGVEVL